MRGPGEPGTACGDGEGRRCHGANFWLWLASVRMLPLTLTLSPRENGERGFYLKLASTISGASLPAWKDVPVSRLETVTRAGEKSIASIL